ncbi:toll/interleukin-1 receptor domain-containing protein [Pseudoalteromonas sp. 20-92]|uniref:toll/interleukin-1 receptor domain-containing protein n=1 Tax=Pseudoalteromonas sp. 20-92 TaxID=2969394 RepID=UPI0027B86C71|nr:toll/interleukin-1 receptor domain-containing protein [Pseudoalteromonas sp. 20-92]MDQ2046029.1 toll/interleukin-1 receptor domain-containing protein [Pseudoalteromonas sp. 20-92]
MPVFISYSHENKEFVDQLAMQLVQQNVHIWLDRWELSLGDSIIDKVQDAADGASALLVILSNASVASEWCKKELSAGLLRELEEKRVVVMPVLLEDCKVPLFARGKLYADFRSNFDDGLKTVIDGIAKVTNPFMNRISAPEYHTDWSIDWGDVNGNFALIINFVEQAKDQPFTVLTNIELLASPAATLKYHQISQAENEEVARASIITTVHNYLSRKSDLKPRLSSEYENVERLEIPGDEVHEIYSLRIGTRRLGEDTGKDILVNVSNLILQAHEHMTSVLKSPVTEV